MDVDNRENYEYVVASVKKSFLPAFVCMVVFSLFYLKNPFEDSWNNIANLTFYVLSFLSVLTLLSLSKAKPFFTFVLCLISYMYINWIRRTNGNDMCANSEFVCLCFAIPINLSIFCYVENNKLNDKFNVQLLIMLLLQMSIIQHFSEYIMLLPYIDANFGCVPIFAFFVWLMALTYMFIKMCYDNTNLNIGFFYSSICIFLGLFYADNISGFASFFCCGIIILFITMILHIFTIYKYDVLTNVYSYNSYIGHSLSKFPYKYTIVLYSIDEYENIEQYLGINRMKELEQMVVNEIYASQSNIDIYRCNKTSMIIVYKNEIAKHVSEYAQNIKRSIASSNFVFGKDKIIKITISMCVSEKTRKDADALVVLARAEKSLLTGRKFNNNIVTVA